MGRTLKRTELVDLLTDVIKVTFLRELSTQGAIKASMFTSEIRRFTKQFGEFINLDWADEQAQRNVDIWLESINAKISRKIGRLIAEGATIEQARNKLRRDLKGLIDAEIETIFRTQSQMAFQAARYQADQEEEGIWGYKYITMGDDRVRPEHEELDGITREKDDPFWQTYWPPNGWNCRCQVVTLFTKRRQTRIPRDIALPDVGFQFNPGQIFNV